MFGASTAQMRWRDDIGERFRHASLATSDLTVGPSVSACPRGQHPGLVLATFCRPKAPATMAASVHKPDRQVHDFPLLTVCFTFRTTSAALKSSMRWFGCATPANQKRGN